MNTDSNEPIFYADLNHSYLYGNKANRYKIWNRIAWLIALFLSIMAGLAFSMIATIAITTVFALPIITWVLPCLLIISGLVITIGNYTHFLKSTISNLWLGIWQSLKDEIFIKRLMKDKEVRRLLLSYFLKLQMSRSFKKDKRRKKEFNIDEETLKIYSTLVTTQLTENNLEQLLQNLLLTIRDPHSQSPLHELIATIKLKQLQFEEDTLLQKSIQRKQWILTTLYGIAFIAGSAFGSVTFTHTLEGLSHFVFLTQLGPAAVPIIAAICGIGITFIFGFFLMNSFRQTILRNLVQDFISSSYQSLRPNRPLNSFTNVFTYLGKVCLTILPFILLAAALILVTYSACGLLIHSSTTAFTYLAQLFAHLIPFSATSVSWLIAHHFFNGLSCFLIGAFFIPVHLSISFIYSSEALQRVYAMAKDLYQGKFNLTGRVKLRIHEYEQNYALVFKDILRTSLVALVLALLTINLLGKAAIPSEFVKIETGSLKASLLIASLDFILQWLSTIPFLLGGKNKHHDHGEGVAGNAMTISTQVMKKLLPENKVRRWQANHLSLESEALYQALPPCSLSSVEDQLFNSMVCTTFIPSFWEKIEKNTLDHLQTTPKLGTI